MSGHIPYDVVPSFLEEVLKGFQLTYSSVFEAWPWRHQTVQDVWKCLHGLLFKYISSKLIAGSVLGSAWQPYVSCTMEQPMSV